MRLRLVVIVAFISAAAVPGLIAYSTGLLPGPTPASADVAKVASPEFHVLGRSGTSNGAGHPGASGATVVWAAWPGRRGAGTTTL